MKYEIKKFRDEQITAKIIKKGDLHIRIRGNSYEDLFRIASVKEAWDSLNLLNKNAISTLTIFCLIGQRSDRRFEQDSSFDLKIIAKFINSLKFDQVEILHPHSSVSLALIEKSIRIDHFEYVKKAYKMIGEPILISPDAGAYKSVQKIAEKLGADLIPANKIRVNGRPKISVQGYVEGKQCLIVDDLADGGRTFKYLAEALTIQGATKVFLYVTHGQFTYGFDELKEFIEHVFCTNSYKDISDPFVTQFAVV